MSDFEFAGPNPFTNSPQSNTPLGVKPLFDGDNSQDFGRESLGIFDINNSDFGRESLTFLNSDFGRESLGIINLNNLDVGRESLGITNIKTYDFVLSNVNLSEIPELNETGQNDLPKPTKSSETLFHFNTNKTNNSLVVDDSLPEVLISKTNDKSGSSISLLNAGFLRQPLSSVSSIGSSLNPSFNSASLDSTLLSRISVSTSGQFDIMNDAFGDTSDFMKRLLNIRCSTSSAYSPLKKKIGSHGRIYSLPSSLEPKSKDLPIYSLEKSREKLNTTNSELEENLSIDGQFNDSVFIESKHIASRIADGSLLELDGNDMLDSTQEPEDFVNISILVDDEPVKFDKEAVFKTVDKMFLPHDKNGSVSKDNNNLNILERCNRSNSSNKSSNSNSKSKEAIEIITTLSEMLNNDTPTEKQRSEGQNLLSSLAEILLSSTSPKSCILDDSGHSSIESEPATAGEAVHCYEVLDLTKKSCSEVNISQTEEACVPLDLSLKSKSASEKSFVSPKILPPKFNKNPHRSFLNPQINQSLASNCSISSNDSKNSNDSSKFRPKTSGVKQISTKRGPMKAVLPVDNMARRNSASFKITPKRSESKPSNCKIKKTSTPINETNLKPMAQSTPDNPRTECPSSPVSRPKLTHDSSSKTLKQKLNYSGSNLPVNKNLENKPKGTSLLRRGSSGELRKPQNTQKQFVRSYSLGEKSGFSNKTAGSIKPTSQRNSFSQSKTQNSASVLKENRNKPVVRASIGKKIGKENVR